MKVELSGGELGTLRALVFIRLNDVQGHLVTAEIHEDAFPSELAFEQADRLRQELRDLKLLVDKLDAPFRDLGVKDHA